MLTVKVPQGSTLSCLALTHRSTRYRTGAPSAPPMRTRTRVTGRDPARARSPRSPGLRGLPGSPRSCRRRTVGGRGADVAGTGFCGALTTFSTFGYETMRLVEDGAWRQAAGTVIGSVTVGMGAVIAGWAAGSALGSM